MTTPYDPDATRWTAQDQALRDLHRDALTEPVPTAMLDAVRRAGNQRPPARQRWAKWGGIAATVALAFCLGWITNSQWHRQAPARSLANATETPRAFAHDAALAHAVYLPEKRHPVEVAADQQEHLVQWLSRRLGRPLKVPDLSANGYALVGGRLLPGQDGARAQFMFEDAGHQRVTLYIGAVDKSKATHSGDAAFNLADDGGVRSFYWLDQGFGYALSGTLTRDALLALATAVYQQL